MLMSISFNGNIITTIVTRKDTEIKDWIKEILKKHSGQKVIGFDVKWKASDNPNMTNKAATLQLCLNTDCAIIQLAHLNRIPKTLKDFLMNRNCSFFGVNLQRKMEKLSGGYGLNFRTVFDLTPLAMNKHPHLFSDIPSFRDLARMMVGFIIPDPERVRLSDWEAISLQWHQTHHACVDAFVCYRIGVKLNEPVNPTPVKSQNRALTIG